MSWSSRNYNSASHLKWCHLALIPALVTTPTWSEVVKFYHLASATPGFHHHYEIWKLLSIIALFSLTCTH